MQVKLYIIRIYNMSGHILKQNILKSAVNNLNKSGMLRKKSYIIACTVKKGLELNVSNKRDSLGRTNLGKFYTRHSGGNLVKHFELSE